MLGNDDDTPLSRPCAARIGSEYHLPPVVHGEHNLFSDQTDNLATETTRKEGTDAASPAISAE